MATYPQLKFHKFSPAKYGTLRGNVQVQIIAVREIEEFSYPEYYVDDGTMAAWILAEEVMNVRDKL